ncbi:MAG: hypothetical protein IJM54_04275, partial [Thermoguttaceae bacterium]|nr:hypothetical protein [Thermoguttaceae bacterium]
MKMSRSIVHYYPSFYAQKRSCEDRVVRKPKERRTGARNQELHALNARLPEGGKKGASKKRDSHKKRRGS